MARNPLQIIHLLRLVARLREGKGNGPKGAVQRGAFFGRGRRRVPDRQLLPQVRPDLFSRPVALLRLSRRGSEPIGFGREGTLYSYTVSYMPSLRFEAPFYAGWVNAREGVRVFAPLVIEEEAQLIIGMKMESSLSLSCGGKVRRASWDTNTGRSDCLFFVFLAVRAFHRVSTRRLIWE